MNPDLLTVVQYVGAVTIAAAVIFVAYKIWKRK